METAMDVKQQALISIIIPVYNAEKYLIRALESARVQTYENIEILLKKELLFTTQTQVRHLDFY